MQLTETDTLICWMGHTDLNAAAGEDVGLGPVAEAVAWGDAQGGFREVHILSDYGQARTRPFVDWLRDRTDRPVHVHPFELTSPMAFGEIYQAARDTVRAVRDPLGDRAGLYYHLSPGTPAMAAVWVILAKTAFPARLLESSTARGVRVTSVPFDISVDFLPDLLSAPDAQLRARAHASPPQVPGFESILHRSQVMARSVARARRVAVRNVPVLIEGESGTGKELFARAIHATSQRRDGPFVAVNCGAIPESLVESELFGHTKGAFSGAFQHRDGHFRAAHHGTLFLDEVGELTRNVQVKLLRALQEGEVTPVGASQPISVDVRIICATHRNLFQDAADGAFRTDLFYRLAVAVLALPPLRQREGDVGLLSDAFLAEINRENADQPGYRARALSAGARNLLAQHTWPGNVRELRNTLQRAALWSESDHLSKADIRDALLTGRPGTANLLDRPIGGDFNLNSVLNEVAAPYLRRALEQAGGNKTQAAGLLGLNSRQTLNNWLKKCDVEP